MLQVESCAAEERTVRSDYSELVPCWMSSVSLSCFEDQISLLEQPSCPKRFCKRQCPVTGHGRKRHIWRRGCLSYGFRSTLRVFWGVSQKLTCDSWKTVKPNVRRGWRIRGHGGRALTSGLCTALPGANQNTFKKKKHALLPRS